MSILPSQCKRLEVCTAVPGLYVGSWGAKQRPSWLSSKPFTIWVISQTQIELNQGLTDRKFVRPPHKHCKNLLRKIHVSICVWDKNGIFKENIVFFKGFREKKHSKGTDKAYWSTELTTFMQQILDREEKILTHNTFPESEIHKQFNGKNTYWIVPRHYEVEAPLLLRDHHTSPEICLY